MWVCTKLVKLAQNKLAPSIYHNFMSMKPLRFTATDVGSLMANELPGSHTISGWIKSARLHKNRSFLHVYDGLSAAAVQVVVPGDVDVDKSLLKYGAAVSITGCLVDSPSSGQKKEFLASDINVDGAIDTEKYPFAVNTRTYDADYARNYLHLRSKLPEFAAMLRLRNRCKRAIHDYFYESNFIQIDTPILTSNDCEGAGDTFTVSTHTKDTSYFGDGRRVNLTVSGQLHLEACTAGLTRVYTFGPTFRADNAVDRTHLAEFYMLEAEIGFVKDITNLLNLIEDFLKTVSRSVLESSMDDMLQLRSGSTNYEEMDVSRHLQRDFQRLSYTDAIKLLDESNVEFKYRPKWGKDIYREHEHVILREFDDTPVFITDWPKDLKPFYMNVNDDGQTVACVDLIAPGPGELFGGSVRESRYEVLEESLRQMGLVDEYQWYLDLRRCGMPLHAGFGMGFERLLQFLFGVKQIRDTIPFPRYAKNCRL